jgi:hypothetical protein
MQNDKEHLSWIDAIERLDGPAHNMEERMVQIGLLLR